MLLGLANSRLEAAHRDGVFRANIDKGPVCANRVTGNRHSLQNSMGIVLQDTSIHVDPCRRQGHLRLRCK